MTSMHRNSTVQGEYLAHIARRTEENDDSCDMCRLINERPVEVEPASELPLTNVCIIENDFPYENNDGRKVIKHHMIVPREHFSKNSELTEETRKELHDTIDALLDSGAYHSAYSRSSYNPATSVPLHLHTHLFKFGPKLTKQLFDPANGVNEITFEVA